jgi:protein transport protein SEC39
MGLDLTPSKLLLLAVHFTINADIESLAALVANQASILRKDLVLRILLTYLPETLRSDKYVSFIEELSTGEFSEHGGVQVDTTAVEHITNGEASKKIRKLQLLQLTCQDPPFALDDDPITTFLLCRAYRMDQEAGLLDQLPDLLRPFLIHSPGIRTWMISVLLPLLRRNYEYYPQQSMPYTLLEFQNLPDRLAVEFLLSRTGTSLEDPELIGRDLRGLIGPWLYNDVRWKEEKGDVSRKTPTLSRQASSTVSPCPGWESFLEWLVSQASNSWVVPVQVIRQWDGPADVDLGDIGGVWLNEEQQSYLESRYARAALASAYLISEPTLEALDGIHKILQRVATLLDQEPSPDSIAVISSLAPVPEFQASFSPKTVAHMRDGLLNDSNPLTSPNAMAISLMHGLVTSAYLLSRRGIPCTIRRAGDLFFLQDEHEQKSEALKFIHATVNNASKSDDSYWLNARDELLWLQSWGRKGSNAAGVFGRVKKEFIEIEFLKASLSNMRKSNNQTPNPTIAN